MGEDGRANVPVVEMTVPRQEKAGVLNVCNVVGGRQVPSKPPQGSEEIMHRGNSPCCFSAGFPGFCWLFPLSYPKILSGAQKLIIGELTSGKPRWSASSAAPGAAQGPDRDFSKYLL